jgi:hypothetical protein
VFTSLAYAGGGMETGRPSWESQRYLMEGVHYLINEGDRDTAREFFRKAILSSSFRSLSGKDGADEMPRPIDKWVASEAFYFLGKIHYEEAVSQGAVPQNIAWAKRYLEKANEYGIVHDRLHPPLLEELNRRYPGVGAPPSEAKLDRAKIIIEVDRGSYEIDTVKVDHNADVTESSFQTNREFDLECGARYKIKPNVQRRNKSMYGALTAIGIGLVVWLMRG